MAHLFADAYQLRSLISQTDRNSAEWGMIFVLVAAIGIIAARWLGWHSVLMVAAILAIAVGIEGALEARGLFKVLKRGFEVNTTLQGAYLATVYVMHSKALAVWVKK